MKNNLNYFLYHNRLAQLVAERKLDLLWIANTEVGRRLLNNKLESPVVDLSPNSYTVHEEKNIYTARFFSDRSTLAEVLLPVLAKLDIYKDYQKEVEKPYEALLHYSGFEEKNRIYPHIHLTTDTFNIHGSEGTGINSGKGRVECCHQNYSTARAGNGVFAMFFDSEIQSYDFIPTAHSPLSTAGFFIVRNFSPYVTTALPVGASISSAFLQYRGYINPVDDDHGSFHTVSSGQASMETLQFSDWATTGSTSFGSILFSNWSTTGDNVIALNSSGRANIVAGGNTKFANVHSMDLTSTAPSGLNVLNYLFNDNTLNFLSVTYNLASSASPSISPSPSQSPSASASKSASPSNSPSGSPSSSPSASQSISASASLSPSLSLSPSASASASGSLSESISASPSMSASVSPSRSLSPSRSKSPSASASPSEIPEVVVSRGGGGRRMPKIKEPFDPERYRRGIEFIKNTIKRNKLKIPRLKDIYDTDY